MPYGGISVSQVRILKPIKNNKGYSSVYLRADGKTIRQSVHRLVAEAFIPNPENKPFVNHKDFNSANNRVENLNWCTNKENIQYSADAGRMSFNNKITPAQVKEIREKRASGKYTFQKLGVEYGLTRQAVSLITRGKSWRWV